MADYINKNILSQAYFHVEPERIQDETSLANFKEELLRFAKSRTEFFMHPDAQVQVDFEEGSLKGRVTVIGTIMLLMQGVANYKDFREGIQLIYNDSRRLSEYIISEALFAAGSKHDDVIRLEARAGIVGTIQKVITVLEQVKRGADGSMPASEIIKKMNESSDEISKLIDNIQDPQDKTFVINGMTELLKQLPENPTSPKNRQNTQADIAEYQRRKKRFIDWLEQVIAY